MSFYPINYTTYTHKKNLFKLNQDNNNTNNLNKINDNTNKMNNNLNEINDNTNKINEIIITANIDRNNQCKINYIIIILSTLTLISSILTLII